MPEPLPADGLEEVRPAAPAPKSNRPRSSHLHDREERARCELAAEKAHAEELRLQRRKKRGQTMSTKELAAIDRLQGQKLADDNREFIRQSFKTATSDAGVTMEQGRQRAAQVELELLLAKAEEEGFELHGMRKVEDANVLFVRGIPAYATQAELVSSPAFKHAGSRAVTAYLHQRPAWEMLENEQHHTREKQGQRLPYEAAWEPLKTWGLVVFQEQYSVTALVQLNTTPLWEDGRGAVLGKSEDTEGFEFPVDIFASNLTAHLRADRDGTLWDAWLALCTVHLFDLPGVLGTQEALPEFFLDKDNIPVDSVEQLDFIHGYDAEAGDIVANALVTVNSVATMLQIVASDLVWDKRHSATMTKRLRLVHSDHAADVKDDIWIDVDRIKRERKRYHAARPVSPQLDAEGDDTAWARKMDMYEVQMALADGCMKNRDYYNARRHYQTVLDDPQASCDHTVLKKAKDGLDVSTQRYTYECKKMRANAHKRAKESGESSFTIPPTEVDCDSLAAIADRIRTRRESRKNAARDAHRASRLKANSNIMFSGIKTETKAQLKWGVGKKKKKIDLAAAVGGAGYGQLLQLSDGMVLHSGKRKAQWNQVHNGVSDTICRARNELADYAELGAKCLGKDIHNQPIYSVRNHGVPQTRQETLNFVLTKIDARGPANVAPRPDNQFGHQCVVPAFTQIDRINAAVNCVVGQIEQSKLDEEKRRQEKNYAIKRVQAIVRTRAARQRVSRMKFENLVFEKQQQEKRAEEQRQADVEAARRAAESPDTRQCRLLFEETDDDNSGLLDRAEIKTLAKRLGKRLSKAQLDGAMQEMDADNSGEVDFDEFCSWWKSVGSKNKGFLGGVLSVFSIGTLRQKKIQEAHISEGIGHDPTLHHREEAHASMMEQKEAEEKRVNNQHLQHIEEVKRHADEATRHLMMTDDLNAGVFNTETTRVLKYSGGHGVKSVKDTGKTVAHVATIFEKFRLGGDRDTGADRGRAFQNQQMLRTIRSHVHLKAGGFGVQDALTPQPPEGRSLEIARRGLKTPPMSQEIRALKKEMSKLAGRY